MESLAYLWVLGLQRSIRSLGESASPSDRNDDADACLTILMTARSAAAHKAKEKSLRRVTVGFGFAPGDESELGPQRRSAEAEGFCSSRLQSADGAHDVGKNEGVEALDEMAIE